MGVAELDGIYVSGVPHYEPEGMRRWIILCVSFMSVLSISAVGLRFLSRRLRKQKLWWDDYMIVFSMVWNWAVVAVGFAMYIEGAGYHAKDLSQKSVENITMWLLITEIIYVWNLCWTKLSLLFMYYRIFHFPYFKRLVICAGTFVVLWAFTVSFLFTFICVPVQKLWKPDLEGHCVSELGVWLANASSTIFSDIMILCLPIPQIWKLNLKKSEKIGLTFLFSLGFFAVFASSFRTWVLFNYSKSDISYTLSPLLVWSDIEMCAGIICACLPTIRPVVNAAARKMGLNAFIFTDRSQGSSGQPRSGDGVPNLTIGESGKMRKIPNRQNDEGEADTNPFYRLPDLSEIDIDSGTGSSDSDAKFKSRQHARVVEADGQSERTVTEDIPLERLPTKGSIV